MAFGSNRLSAGVAGASLVLLGLLVLPSVLAQDCAFQPSCRPGESYRLAIPCEGKCSNYIQCQDGQATEKKCGKFFWRQNVFDAATLDCVGSTDCDWWRKIVTSTVAPTSAPTTTTTPASTSTSTPASTTAPETTPASAETTSTTTVEPSSSSTGTPSAPSSTPSSRTTPSPVPPPAGSAATAPLAAVGLLAATLALIL